MPRTLLAFAFLLSAAPAERPLQGAEVGASFRIENDGFAVEDHRAGVERAGGGDDRGEAVRPVMPAPRQDAYGRRFDMDR